MTFKFGSHTFITFQLLKLVLTTVEIKQVMITGLTVVLLKDRDIVYTPLDEEGN